MDRNNMKKKPTQKPAAKNGQLMGASEALAQHRNLVYRAALEKLKAGAPLETAELEEVQRREVDELKRAERQAEREKAKKGGRKSGLTKEVIEQICAIVRDGGSYVDAALEIGVRKQTISEWMARKEEGGAFAELSERVEKAKAELRNWHKANVNRIARNGSLQASLKYLEVHDSNDWRPKMEHTGAGGAPLNPTNVAVIFLPDNGRSLPEEPKQIGLNGNGHAIPAE